MTCGRAVHRNANPGGNTHLMSNASRPSSAISRMTPPKMASSLFQCLSRNFQCGPVSSHELALVLRSVFPGCQAAHVSFPKN